MNTTPNTTTTTETAEPRGGAQTAPAYRIPTQAEYEAREAARLGAQLRDVEAAPLADRREARADWTATLRNPQALYERASWLLDGSYGFGAMARAHRIASNANAQFGRAHHLGVLLAALEDSCSARFAELAYKSLTAGEKIAVNGAITRAIEEWEQEQREEAATA